ncbi:SH3-containing GRB2-like protein 3-interacting protein 1, partial [Malurus melanocephalus]|uniref:SH3-containing GRB2-like protein 3-interacting protein 1 n=1 Tax=Malurus melanocephalus TaxID=175006 RepID=UPI002548AE5C
MMEGLKKRTRKAFGIRKKEKDTDSTGSPDRDGIQPSPHPNDPPANSKPESAREGGNKNGKKTNGAPNGFYAEIDWDRYVSAPWSFPRGIPSCSHPDLGILG